MLIEIESENLLEILVDANIEALEAKALIFDIISLQEKGKFLSNKQTTSMRLDMKNDATPPTRRVELSSRTTTDEEDEEVYEENYEEEVKRPRVFSPKEEEVERNDITRVRSKTTTKRPNFGSFGGDSAGLSKG